MLVELNLVKIMETMTSEKIPDSDILINISNCAIMENEVNDDCSELNKTDKLMVSDDDQLEGPANLEKSPENDQTALMDTSEADRGKVVDDPITEEVEGSSELLDKEVPIMLTEENIEMEINLQNVNDDSDDSDININITQKCKRKTKTIQSSDDNSASETESNKIQIKTKKSLNNLIDSDSPTPTDSESDNTEKEEAIKKRKKFTKKKEKNKSIIYDKDEDEDEDENGTSDAKQVKAKLQDLCDNDTTSDSKSSSENENNEIVAPKERPPVRMTAKEAKEQMKLIQSVSQKIAREANVKVPYHMPKQRSLKEFLNRRTLAKSSVSAIDLGCKKPLLDVRMSQEELEVYAKQMDERAKEAVEFYKNENEEIKIPMPFDEKIEPIVEMQESIGEIKDPIDEIKEPIAEMEEKVEVAQEIGNTETIQETVPSVTQFEKGEELEEKLNLLLNEPITNKSEFILLEKDHIPQCVRISPDEKNPMLLKFQKRIDDIMGDQPEINIKDKKISNFSPSLSGTPNSIINLETGDITKPKLSGPDKLLERFIQHSKKVKSKSATKISVLSTENGFLEIDTLTVNLAEPDTIIKDPKPGAALVKLKQTLSQKITEKRKIECLRKFNEMQAEIEDDMEEFSDCGYDEEEYDEDNEEYHSNRADSYNEEEEADNENITNEYDKKINVFEDKCEEKEVKDSDDDYDDDDDKDVDDDSDDEQDDGEKEEVKLKDIENNIGKTVENIKKKSRIISVSKDDDDSDEDTQNDETRRLNKSVSDIFRSQDENEHPMPNGQSLREFIERPSNAESYQSLFSQNDKIVDEDDLMGLCSGNFESISNNAINHEKTNLFTQSSQNSQNENELFALCSGTFETLIPNEKKQSENDSDSELKNMKLLLESSSEDETKFGVEKLKKKKKSNKKKKLGFSDDEEELELHTEINYADNKINEDEDNDIEDEDRCIDYDSEENEIEVVMNKNERRNAAKNFLENEAELSESEWGSEDENEDDLDKLDLELCDETEVDEQKIQRELEKMHMRRVLDQDTRELKIIQEMLFEDEERDGVGRERKFRWKNIDNTLGNGNDEQLQKNNDDEEKHESDDENEEFWRRMRHEREIFLQENSQNENQSPIVSLQATLEINSVETAKIANIRKKITIIKTTKSETQPIKDSPFLIAKHKLFSSAKSSFLTRDDQTLTRLASLTKNTGDECGTLSGPGKAGNYVFTVVSPAVKEDENKTIKRKLEDKTEIPNVVKRQKILQGNVKSKKRLLDHLG